MSSDSKDRTQGLSLKTLLISALAALLAAVVVSLFWEQGTLIATAITPVIVALAREGLARPADKLGEAASSVAAKTTLADGGNGASDSAQVGETSETEDEEKKRSDGALRRRHIKIALVTGVLAFVIVAAVLTVSELATGGSVSTDGRTTLFGGSETPSSSQNDGKPQSDQAPDTKTDQQDGTTEDQPPATQEEPQEEAPREEVPPPVPQEQAPSGAGEMPAPSGSSP